MTMRIRIIADSIKNKRVLLLTYEVSAQETINFNIGSFDDNIAGANSLNGNANSVSQNGGFYGGGGMGGGYYPGGFGGSLAGTAQVLAYDVGQDLRMLMGG
ncbi:unnamed protein product [Gongylonema pulchrum]|uniref:PE-PGRS family protein n=1 Tax=Gongylonema pulchrum TaxID=637853 RepID=A0A183D013_9BILA|nr:unnamed protein product [Gongylonema pulchrum]